MKLKKTGITLQTFGGLANRMRAIDSAYLISQHIQCPYHVLWEKSFELNCSFFRLFNPIKNLNILEYHSGGIKKRVTDHMVRTLWKTGIRIPTGFSKYYNDQDILHLKRSNYSFEDFKNHQPLFIRTVNRFYDGDHSLNIFQPIAELQSIIDRYHTLYGKNMLGIHIRRTDNMQSVRYSPLQGFYDIMDAEIQKDPTTMFYIATDSPEDEKNIRSRYLDRIISHDKSLSRNSEKGIQDALIDLYCLSNTQKIIGSYYSSFSEVAAQIRNIELLLVYNKDKK